MRCTRENATLVAIYYATVGPFLEKSEIIRRFPSMTRFPKGGKSMFVDYFCSIHNSRKKNIDEYTAQLVDKNHHHYSQPELETLLKSPISSKSKKFEETCSGLTDRFLALMHPKANEGILFFARFKKEKQNYLCILKLEPTQGGVLYVAKNLVKYDNFEEMLPGPKDMQKGAIYPHPTGIPGAIKVAQIDGRAEYFDHFLGAYRAESTPNTIRFLLDSVEDARDRPIDYMETQKLFDTLLRRVSTGDVTVSQDELVDVLIKSVQFEDKDDARRKLRGLASKRHIELAELGKHEVENMKIKVRIDNIEIVGTRKALRENVVFTENDEKLRAVVTGTRFDVTAGLR